jgi:cytochrome c556
MRLRQLVWLGRTILLLGATSCLAPRPVARPSVAWPPPAGERECRDAEGAVIASGATIAEVMRRSVNPSLSRISWLLFHDPRPEDAEARTQDLAHAAEAMARCFGVIPAREKPAAWTEFDVLATMQSHNAVALADAALQNDIVSQRHWYMHIKETCQSCHSQYRFINNPNPRGSSGDAQ